MTGDKTPVVTQGIAGLAMSHMTRGITAMVACGAMRGTTGRVNWYMTGAVARPTPDRISCETTDEGLRAVTAETALQTMYDTTLPTKDQTTVQTASQTIRRVVP